MTEIVLTVFVGTGEEAVVSEFFAKAVQLDAKVGYVDLLIYETATKLVTSLDEVAQLISETSLVIYWFILRDYIV